MTFTTHCPKCGSGRLLQRKAWELKGGKTKKTVIIASLMCKDCRIRFRQGQVWFK